MTDNRTTPPFRADHVGSLLRPPELLSARDDHAAGRIDADELRAIEDDAIRDVVEAAEGRRAAVGHRRRVPPRLVAHGLHLPARRDRAGRRATITASSSATSRGPSSDARRRCASTEKVSLDHTIFADAFEFLHVRGERGRRRSSRSRRRAWSTTAAAGRRSTRASTPTSTSSGSDLSAAYAERARARSASSAARYLQLDDTEPRVPQRPRASASRSAARAATPSICTSSTSRNINAALAGKPDGMAVTTHLCRGNFRSSWAAEGGYDFVAEALFGELERRRLLPRVRRRALGRVRAAAVRAQGQARRARPGHDQARRARVQGHAQAPDRGGRAVRRRSSSCACRRSAASPRPSRATCSRARSRSPSSS